VSLGDRDFLPSPINQDLNANGSLPALVHPYEPDHDSFLAYVNMAAVLDTFSLMKRNQIDLSKSEGTNTHHS
jgi:hypothetical protein